MIDAFFVNLDTLLLLLFGGVALAAAAAMIVARQPMRVAMALIVTMVSLGVVYGLLGVHFIAAFQVLIYVGAVLVFLVFVVATAEIALAIPIVLLLVRSKRTLDLAAYSDLKG